MDDTLKKTTGGLMMALALGGCGEASGLVPGTDPVSDPTQIEAAITQDLDRLRALQIVDAGYLVMNLPVQATACYGLPPCPGWEDRYRDERMRQAGRLGRLVDIAATTASTALVPRPESEAAAAVAALSALAVVEVRALVTMEPKSNPRCYNLPCASDRDAASQENGRRVAAAFAIAETARKSGL